MLFNENGILSIDEIIVQQESYQKIMEDGVVTDEEIDELTFSVVSCLHEVEKTFSPEQVKLVEELLVDTSVLYAAYKQKEIQDIHP